MSCAVDTYDSGPHFKWITRSSVDRSDERGHTTTSNNNSMGYNQLLNSMRFTIQDLIQQESCIGSSNYPVDKPSRLVQIECRKPGCRCVLKNERALAMKIIPGITLIQAEWLLPNSIVSNVDKSQPHHTSTNKNGYNQNVPNSTQMKSSCSHSVVLTSCCPTWFELVQKSHIGSSDTGSKICPEVPVWSSCKAVWRAKPKFILLRKDTQCLFSTNTQSLIMSSTDLLKKDDPSMITLDADKIGILRPGTILQLIDCRLCRLVHKEDNQISSYRLSVRHRLKPVSMLQCIVVGGKALAALASSSTLSTNLSSQDALNWFHTGPRLVYLSLASKSIMCSPVKIPPTISVHNSTNHHQHHHKNSSHMKLFNNELDYHPISDHGVHNILSLLSTYRLPLITRPIVGLHSNEWFFMGKSPNQSILSNTNPNCINMHSLLQICSCHHGDLIFLEPLSDCTQSVQQQNQSIIINEDGDNPTKSRFFVVTTDMLSHHYFLVADTNTCETYHQQLEVHAFKVAHFLASYHPVQGLSYILKHLEDITHLSNIGPSYLPLTRTFGPITNRLNTTALIQSAILSIAAIASLTMHEELNDIPQDLNQLNEIQPKIMHYLTLNSNNNNNNSNNNNSITTTTSSTTTNNHYNSSMTCHGYHNSMHTSSSNDIHDITSMNHLINSNLNTQFSLSSSLFTSEIDEMNALCDEIDDIYFYVRNGHFPMQSHSLSSLLHHTHHTHHRHADRNANSNNLSAPISPHLNKLSTNNQFMSNEFINPKLSINNEEYVAQPTTTTATNHHHHNHKSYYQTLDDNFNQLNNFPVKITSKAPVLLIRPKPYHDNQHYYSQIDNENKERKPEMMTTIPIHQQNHCTTATATTTGHQKSNYMNVYHRNPSNHCALHETSSIINDVNSKPQVFPYTSNLVTTATSTTTPSTTTTITNSNQNTKSSLAFTPLMYCSASSHLPINQSFTQFTPTYKCEDNIQLPVSQTNTMLTTGYHSTQNITKLNYNHTNHNDISCTHQSIHSTYKQPLYSSMMLSSYHNCSNLPSSSSITCCLNQMSKSSKPLFTTSTLNILSTSKQNLKSFQNQIQIEESIYDEPKNQDDDYSMQQQQQHQYKTLDHNHTNTTGTNNFTYDYGYHLSSSSPSHNRHQLSLSTSHIVHPSVSRSIHINDDCFGNVWSSTTNNNKNSTGFQSINNVMNDRTTSTMNCVQIMPSNVVTGTSSTTTNTTTTTTTPSNINNNVSHHFTSHNQPSCMTTSFHHQSVQNSFSSIQQPPSMPLLYPLSTTFNHTSRLYQSTIISPSPTSNDNKKQIPTQQHSMLMITRPSSRYVTSTTNLNFTMSNYDNQLTMPSSLFVLQSPKLKRSDFTNSSPDTGIGIESTYDQQTSTTTTTTTTTTTPTTSIYTDGGGVGGPFIPSNTYHHSFSSSSSSNLAVWSPSHNQCCQHLDRQNTATVSSTMMNEINSGKYFTSCKLTTTFPPIQQTNQLINSPMNIMVNTIQNYNLNNKNQSNTYRF